MKSRRLPRAALVRMSWLFRRIGQQDRPDRIVGDAGCLEELDVRVHAVALADPIQPRPGVERVGRRPRLPQVDAPGPAVLGVDELLADQPGYGAEARRDGAEMRRAGGEIDVGRQLVLDDRGNHRAVLLGGPGRSDLAWSPMGPKVNGCLIQAVTSAEVKRAQAIAQKITAYTPNESSPCSRSQVAIGERSRESNDSHQCVGRYGWTAPNCGMLSATSLATASTSTAAIAAIECSVNVETARPMAPSAAMAAATYSVTNSSRSSPSASGTVVPESSVTGPTGNSAAPSASETPATITQAASPKMTTATYLTPSSLVRPAGTASR